MTGRSVSCRKSPSAAASCSCALGFPTPWGRFPSPTPSQELQGNSMLTCTEAGQSRHRFHREDTMNRTTPIEFLDSPPAAGRRTFLKQLATTGVMAGAGAMPAWAQEKSSPPTSTSAPASVPASTPGNQPSVAETLARYATSLKYEDLPADLVHETKRLMIDSVGCGLGGF